MSDRKQTFADPMILVRPLVTITNIIWSFDRLTDSVQVLLVKRSDHPYQGCWGLPETYLRRAESAETASLRLISEKIGVKLPRFHTEQLATFTDPRRSPPPRTIALTYMIYLPEVVPLTAGTGATDAEWFRLAARDGNYELNCGQACLTTADDRAEEEDYYSDLTVRPRSNDHLAYDHEWILRVACARIRNKLDYQPNIWLILGSKFTLKQARTVYALFFKTSVTTIDNSNFKKTHRHLLKEVGEAAAGHPGRPAKLYRLAHLD